MPGEGLEALRSLATRAPGAALTIGNFDGVHLGHRALVAEARRQARGRPVIAVTFDPHPATLLKPEAAPLRLTTKGTKLRLLREAGADDVLVLPPTPDLLQMEPEAFFALLKDEARVGRLVEGVDFCFGKGRRGSIALLEQWTQGTPLGLTVVAPVRVPLLDATVVPVSSSLVRFLVATGRVRDAGICLGSYFRLSGPVVKGFQRGRTIGFPTANLDCTGNVVPADGVYAGQVTLSGTVYPAAVNVGPIPTFSDVVRQIEAHVVGFSGDLYGQHLEVELLDFLRDPRKFAGVDALKAQIARDVATTVSLVGCRPAATSSPWKL